MLKHSLTPISLTCRWSPGVGISIFVTDDKERTLTEADRQPVYKTQKAKLRSNTMYEVNQDRAGEKFQAAWRAAGQHLQRLGGKELNWIRANLDPPLAEHLSFRNGNQLFFIYIEFQLGLRVQAINRFFSKYAMRQPLSQL